MDGNNNDEMNFLDMPDDQVMGMSAPPSPPAQPAEPEGAEAPAAEGAPEGGEPDPAEPVGDEPVTPDPVDPPPPADDDGEGDGEGEVPVQEPAAPVEPDAAPKESAEPKDDTPAQDPAASAEPSAEEYKAFYDRLLKNPIKANGKEIQLRSPEEAERLVQMGLNYTKKMQALQPRMRVVTMLENNGLLDEAKLNHLIDVAKGDKLAIQKLLADSKFDPMEVDAEKAASYQPGNHQVSDLEMQFNATLDELEATPAGVELITEVAKQWDEQSRQAAYQDPSVLRTMHEQKSMGLYARIVNEMDHLKALGHLQGVPFLQAYRAVGDMLHAQGRLAQEAPKPAPPAAPVETRVATPAPKVNNSDRARAASPTKAVPATPKQETNYLDLPDDKFLEAFQGRL